MKGDTRCDPKCTGGGYRRELRHSKKRTWDEEAREGQREDAHVYIYRESRQQIHAQWPEMKGAFPSEVKAFRVQWAKPLTRLQLHR